MSSSTTKTTPTSPSPSLSSPVSVFERLRTLLEEKAVAFRVMEHEPAYTSEDAARIRGTSLSSGAKALIVKLLSSTTPTSSSVSTKSSETDGGGCFVMFVMPANQKLASKSVRKQLGVRSLRFASREEVDEITGGLQPGSIPPFGSSLFGIQSVYCDEQLAGEGTINFNAGDHSISISMTFDDYCNVENPTLGSYSQPV